MIYALCRQLSQVKFTHFLSRNPPECQDWGAGGGVKPILAMPGFSRVFVRPPLPKMLSINLYKWWWRWWRQWGNIKPNTNNNIRILIPSWTINVAYRIIVFKNIFSLELIPILGVGGQVSKIVQGVFYTGLPSKV